MSKKVEFSKIIILLDYLIMVVLLIWTMIYPNDWRVTITCAWIAQVGAATGFYYWKSRSDNRIKIPSKVIKSLPEDMRNGLDLTQVIVAIIQQSQSNTN